MATARRPPPTKARDVYAAKLRTLINLYCRDVDTLDTSPWPSVLARVERREPIDVHGWQAGLGPGRWRIHADGRVTRID